MRAAALILCACILVARPSAASPVQQVGGPVSGERRVIDKGESSPRVVTREGSFYGSPAVPFVNCHEGEIGSLKDNQAAVDHRHDLERHHRELMNGRSIERLNDKAIVKFCYYSFVVDDFTLLGTMHRPALSQPIKRQNGKFKYGATSTFVTPKAFVFGDPKEDVYVDAEGYVVYPVEGKPWFRMSGNFSSSANTRPVHENQIVHWKILYSKSGAVDAALTLQQGSFTVFRKSRKEEVSVILEGKAEIDPIEMQGFETGWLGVWMHVQNVDADPKAAKKSPLTCSEIETILRYDESGKVCGMSEVPYCNDASTQQEAYYICNGFGTRVCTTSEINKGAGTGSGCDFDNTTVWTSVDCTIPDSGESGFEVTAGDGKLAVGENQRRCVPATERHAVRCCGDTAEIVVPGKRKFVSVLDQGIVMDFAEPPHAEAYEVAKETAEKEIEEATGRKPNRVPGERPPPVHSKKEGAVAAFDFNHEHLRSSVTDHPEELIDLNSQCNDQPSNFVDSVVFGRARKVLRWVAGTGLVIPDVGQFIDTGLNTHFTISMSVKFDKTECFTRVLNVNPGEDNGLYLCDGIQLTPEIPAGHALKAMEWHHIIVSTTADRHTKIYHNGRLLKSWTLGRTTWKGALMIDHKDLVLFNDCGHMCRCDSVENSGGWISSLHLWNHAITDDEAEANWLLVSENGLVADYHLTKGTLESEIDSAPDLEEIGAQCKKYTRNVLDHNLKGSSRHKVRYVWPGTGLYLPTDGLLESSVYTVMMKIKLPNTQCKGAIFNAGIASSDFGLYVCDALLIYPNTRAGPMIKPNQWHTITISTTVGRRVRLYVDSFLVKEFKMEKTDWEKTFKIVPNGQFSFFTNADKECSDAPENVEGLMANLLVFNRELSYTEVQYHNGKLGSEVQTTISPDHFGGTAPVGTTCVFPFVKYGETFTDCVSGINWCKTSGDIVENELDGEYEWGYCTRGGGYRRHAGRVLSSDGDLGHCRGGVLGCQKACDEIYDCIAFVIDECSQNEVDRSLLKPMHGTKSWIREYMGTTVVHAGPGGVGGAVIEGHPTTVGETYVWIVQSMAPKDNVLLYVSDTDGNEYEHITMPSIHQGTVTHTARVEFVARTEKVTIGVRFLAPNEHDIVTIAAVDLPTLDCEHKSGHMATGVLKGLWIGSEHSPTHSIYQKLRTGPLADADMTNLRNRLTISASVSDYSLNGKHMGSLVDVGEACSASNSNQTADTIGNKAEPAGYSVERNVAYEGEEIASMENVYIIECLTNCSDREECHAVTWDKDTQTCKLVGSAETTSLSPGAVSARKRSLGARYLRFSQLGATTGGHEPGLPWQVRELRLFEDWYFTNELIPAGVGESSGDNAEYAIDDRVANTWIAGGSEDGFLTVDLGEGTAKTVRSVYLRSHASWPGSIVVEESNDGASWSLISVLHDVVEEYNTLLFGTLGGAGGDNVTTHRFKEGTGFAVADICDLIPCEEDVAYTVLVHSNTDFPMEPPAVDTTILSVGDRERTHVAQHGRWVGAKRSSDEVLEDQAMAIEQLRWSRLAVAVNVGGSEMFMRTAEDLIMPLDETNGLAPHENVSLGYKRMVITDEHPLMLFNDGVDPHQCSATPPGTLSTGLVSHVSVFDRELSPTEMQSVGDSLRSKCEGDGRGECFGNGYCKEGTCVCGLTSEGTLCNDRICPGRIMVPGEEDGAPVQAECNARGECEPYEGICSCEWWSSSLYSDYQEDCAADDLYIECDGFIHVVKARYGVYKNDTCEPIPEWTACYFQTTEDYVIEQCEGKRSCDLHMAPVGAAACPGQEMQIQVGWSCTKEPEELVPPNVEEWRYARDCSMALPLWYDPITEEQKLLYPVMKVTDQENRPPAVIAAFSEDKIREMMKNDEKKKSTAINQGAHEEEKSEVEKEQNEGETEKTEQTNEDEVAEVANGETVRARAGALRRRAAKAASHR